MLDLLPKILPIMLYWTLIATYIGGWSVDLKGGSGLTQVLGLILSGILFVVVWRLLHAAFLPAGEVLGGIAITSFVTAALTPAIAWLGFKMVGVSVKPVAAHH